MKFLVSVFRQSGWACGLGVLAFGYGLYCRQLIVSGSSSSTSVGFWDVVLETVGNPQFIIFVLLAAWLLHAILRGGQETAPQRLLRLGTYRKVLAAGTDQASWHLVGMAVVIILAIVVAAYGLPLVSAPSSGLGPQTVSGAFSTVGVPASVASIWQVLQLGLALLVVRVTFTAIRIHVQKPAIEAALAILIWLWAATSTIGLFDKNSPLNAGLYFQAVSAVAQPAAYAGAVLTMGLIGALAMVAALAADARRTKLWRLHVSPAGLQALAVLVVLSLTMQISIPKESSLFGSISFALQGNSGTIVQYLLSTLVFPGYALVFALGQQESTGSWRAVTLIREGSFGGMLRKVAAREFRRALVYLLFVLLVATAAYFVLGGRDVSLPPQGLGIWTYQFFINGLGQLSFYLLLVYAAEVAFGTRLAALISIGLVVVLSPPNIAVGRWLPVQQSAMSLASGGWEAVLPATASLLLAGVSIAVALGLRIRKRHIVI
ncbi:hypothetical protein [Cryobacterium shii]|uniref:Uncharacterized protein n=1 Tax=Cryobacterium shii TaxID=1259235 RepID=A0AAQ2C772_9MICO|nr:hypothetical protein [Cryobacterium shii]TFC48906.1 hypothetical protein E3O49_06765 [Cryobacterium shii]